MEWPALACNDLHMTTGMPPAAASELLHAPSLTDRGSNLHKIVLVLPLSPTQAISLFNTPRPGAQHLEERQSVQLSVLPQAGDMLSRVAQSESEEAPALVVSSLSPTAITDAAGLPEPLLAAAVASSPLESAIPAEQWTTAMSPLCQAPPLTFVKVRTCSAAARWICTLPLLLK